MRLGAEHEPGDQHDAHASGDAPELERERDTRFRPVPAGHASNIAWCWWTVLVRVRRRAGWDAYCETARPKRALSLTQSLWRRGRERCVVSTTRARTIMPVRDGLRFGDVMELVDGFPGRRCSLALAHHVADDWHDVLVVVGLPLLPGLPHVDDAENTGVLVEAGKVDHQTRRSLALGEAPLTAS